VVGGGKAIEALLRKWAKMVAERGERKTMQKIIFFSVLDSDFSLFGAWNPPPFIEGGRGTCCLLWRQILALDSKQKDPNYSFKVVIMA